MSVSVGYLAGQGRQADLGIAQLRIEIGRPPTGIEGAFDVGMVDFLANRCVGLPFLFGEGFPLGPAQAGRVQLFAMPAAAHVVARAVPLRFLDLDDDLIPAAFEVGIKLCCTRFCLTCRRSAPDLQGFAFLGFQHHELSVRVPVRPHHTVSAPGGLGVGCSENFLPDILRYPAIVHHALHGTCFRGLLIYILEQLRKKFIIFNFFIINTFEINYVIIVISSPIFLIVNIPIRIRILLKPTE